MTGDTDKTPDGGYKIKTYYPTLEEMKDFSKYMKHVHETGGHRAGLAKIVAPPEYKPRKAGYDDDKLYAMEILCPIKQKVSGERGLYQQLNMVEKKKVSVRAFKRLAEEKHSTPVTSPGSDTDAELDRMFWKTIFTNPSIYGADLPGTLYDEDVEEFNLGRLNTILDNIKDDYGVTIQGVNTTYLYFGMWKSSFCWHTEDMDLYSINYLHFGQPKSWYCIAPEHGKRFERLAESFFPNNAKTCRAFLRHKTTMISPAILRKFSIPFTRAVQKPGEFMITFPFSYHSGFNQGFNCAEATNFALEYWIDFGKWATRCECSSESVKISMQTFVKRYQSERYENWIRGRDVCKDPRNPKHVAAAPKPTEYDLYLMGKEAGDEVDEETKRKTALQQNQSGNVRSKSKKSSDFRAVCELYEEFLTSHETREDVNSSPREDHYSSISTDMVPLTDYTPMSTLKIPRISIKRKKVEIPKSKVKKPKSEKRALERIINSRELLQFMPVSFTHEKRFNRCMTALPPHCSVCQLFVPHPKDDENIWGSKDLKSENGESSMKRELPKAQDSAEDWSFTSTTLQPTIAGPQVETFTLPESSQLHPVIQIFHRFHRFRADYQHISKSLSLSEGEDKISQVSADLGCNQRDSNSQITQCSDSYDDGAGFSALNLETSELLQCTVCMLSVHRICYGLESMPADRKCWICDRCVMPNRSQHNCVLCPCRGGALKCFDQQWMHITCAMSSQLKESLSDLIEPPDDEERSEHKSCVAIDNDQLSCSYCTNNHSMSKYIQGKCMPCSGYWNFEEFFSCGTSFHVTCGHRNGAKFDIRDLHDSTEQPIKATCAYCVSKIQLFEAEVDRAEQCDQIHHEPLKKGALVVIQAKDELFYDAKIKERLQTPTFEVYYPEECEVELHIGLKRLRNWETIDLENLKIGHQFKIRQGGSMKDRIGKLRKIIMLDEYKVECVQKGTMIVARHKIFRNVDDLPADLLDRYQNNFSRANDA